MLSPDMIPPELLSLEETTTVYGDIAAFMLYVESGQAERDWHERCAMFLRELADFF